MRHEELTQLLLIATRNGDTAWVDRLIEKEDCPQDLLNSTFVEACKCGHTPIMEYLFNKGANIHFESNKGLRRACQEGRVAAVEFLLSKGVDSYVWYHAPLRIACSRGCVDTLKILLDYKADIHANNDSAMDDAVKNDRTNMIHFLFNLKPDYFSILFQKDHRFSSRQELIAMSESYRLKPETVMSHRKSRMTL